jgi:PAS domain S-box-containing protein
MALSRQAEGTRRTVTVYAIAIAALVAAVVLRWLLDPVMGDRLPLVTVFGAVAAAVWVGGYRPAVVVALLGYVVCDLLFLEPRGRLALDDPRNLVGLAAYLFTCSLIIGIGEALLVAQARAAERGEVLRVTLASIGDAVITTDAQGLVTYLNAVAESLTGWTHREALGQPFDSVFRIVNERTREPVESPAARALRDGVVVGLANHTLLIGRDGVERTIDDSAAPIRDEHGRISGCVLIFRDISLRRRWEDDKADRLIEARLLASIVESSDDAIIRKSLAGVIESWNAAAERLFGYTAEQAVGRHISLVIPPDRIAEEDRIIASLKAGQRVDHFETERVRSDGRRVPVSLTISPIKDDDGRVVGASKIVRDVTRQRQAEEESQRFVTLVENSTDFIGICDLDGFPIFVNRAGLEMVGLEGIEEARRVQITDFFFAEDQPRIMNELFPSVLQNGHGEIDVRFRNFRTGEARWMAYKVLRLDDASGRTVAIGTVSQDMTERRRMEDHLRAMAADLSEVDRRKDEFLATLAHELRNPLAPLSNMLEVLRLTGGDGKALPQALDTMERQLGQLVRLVDDLLDLSRITHNRLELRRGPVDLRSVIEQAVEASRPWAEAAGHHVRVIGPAEPIELNADAVRLTQVLGNLLNNSCRYTPAGGTITLSAERSGKEAVLTVEDTGAGIPADKLESVFDMFTQVDRSLERSQGGLGIGLALVKRLVQMHGGSVEAKSAGPGMGSTFVVRLPIVKSRPGAPSEESVAPEPALTHRILVVDDNPDSAESLAMLLQIAGNETFTAHDGESAFTAIEQHRPQAVLLDIGLPTLNGYEVCRRVRQRPWGKEIILIALTGWGQEEDRRRSREAGFDGHLVKPVNFAALVKLLGSLGVGRSKVETK